VEIGRRGKKAIRLQAIIDALNSDHMRITAPPNKILAKYQKN
jgi:hypothetical protein